MIALMSLMVIPLPNAIPAREDDEKHTHRIMHFQVLQDQLEKQFHEMT